MSFLRFPNWIGICDVIVPWRVYLFKRGSAATKLKDSLFGSQNFHDYVFQPIVGGGIRSKHLRKTAFHTVGPAKTKDLEIRYFVGLEGWGVIETNLFMWWQHRFQVALMECECCWRNKWFSQLELLSKWAGCSRFFCGQERWWPLVLGFWAVFCSRPRMVYRFGAGYVTQHSFLSIDIYIFVCSSTVWCFTILNVWNLVKL